MLEIFLDCTIPTIVILISSIILYPTIDEIYNCYKRNKFTISKSFPNYRHFNNSPLYHREYEKINSNSKDKTWDVGDCAVRAIACALNISWKKSFKLLVDEAQKQNKLTDNISVINSVLESHGFEIFDNDAKHFKNMRLHNFKNHFLIKNFYPTQSILIRCHNNVGSHLVCCKGDNYYDAFDSGKFIIDAIILPVEHIKRKH